LQCGVIHVDDIVSAALQCLSRACTVGQIYNLADNTQVTWRQWYDTLADGLHVPRATLSIPRSLAVVLAWLLELLWTIFRLPSRPLLTLFVMNLLSRDQLYPTQRATTDFGWQPRGTCPYLDVVLTAIFSSIQRWHARNDHVAARP
jgi:nucleoside-diphosphate-sugar epimerase